MSSQIGQATVGCEDSGDSERSARGLSRWFVMGKVRMELLGSSSKGNRAFSIAISASGLAFVEPAAQRPTDWSTPKSPSPEKLGTRLMSFGVQLA